MRAQQPAGHARASGCTKLHASIGAPGDNRSAGEQGSLACVVCVCLRVSVYVCVSVCVCVPTCKQSRGSLAQTDRGQLARFKMNLDVLLAAIKEDIGKTKWNSKTVHSSSGEMMNYVDERHLRASSSSKHRKPPELDAVFFIYSTCILTHNSSLTHPLSLSLSLSLSLFFSNLLPLACSFLSCVVPVCLFSLPLGIGHKCKIPPPAVRWIRAGIEPIYTFLANPKYLRY